MRCVAVLCCLLTLLSTTALADDSVPSSGYAPVEGEQFFLLADTSFASDETARVRLEAPGRDWRRYNMEPYGGADIRVYRVPKPLDFLKAQKNLHRIQRDPVFRGEGLANTLAYLWDNWYRQSRRAMQRAFSFDARKTVTEQAPALKMGDAIVAPTRFEASPQFEKLPGLPLVSEFRYPLWDAKPIAPPEGVQLAGSSSEFIEVVEGNVYIPLGRLEPGLYLVEALIGKYRASTVLFVANTVAISKIAGDELLVWTARKHDGSAVPNTTLLWTDGLGVLSSGRTDGEGLLRLAHASPERSYVIGEDAEGGVFVSENFYYDSEIYDTKLYAFTDRPLYRPGDFVEVKIIGREFKNARDSVAPQAAPMELKVIDANGSELQSLPVQFDPAAGAQTRFQLPGNATAGGYELRFSYRDQWYGAAFRVAEYIKPHFEIVLALDKADFRTGEAVTGRLNLLYPDGKPVKNARLELTLRAQQLAMVDNELQYLGQFPVQLSATELSSDARGQVRLELPAAEQPSRYLLTVFASDGAAFRVKTSREILIERGAAQYRLSADRRFSAAGDEVTFRFALEGQPGPAPASYDWVRLEDRSRGEGIVDAKAGMFKLRFAQPGSYNLNLRDANGQILGGTAHAVSGSGSKAAPGSIEIVFDRAEYRAGDTAQALITFPEPTAEALLTLERDRVEATALASRGGDWLQLERLNDTQWRARIPVRDHFAPNLTFSVLYTARGDYSFQNAGIKVTVPQIAVDVRTEREVYRPGETVTVELSTTLDGKPLPARLSVSVVDEMIYALQPEIAPGIDEFFYHPRRNNVRTSASLSFISYDVALPGAGAMPASSSRSERGVKVLERPRREDIDTAAWQPDLVTDDDGKARFSFKMPDSLTRWRITARAIDTNGVVGQRRAFLRSEKPLYLKWTGPSRFRAEDRPALGLLAFNLGSEATQAELVTRWAGQAQRQPVQLARGVNYLPLPTLPVADGELIAQLEQQGQAVDALSVSLRQAASGWTTPHSQAVALTSASTAIDLPADARDLELRLATGPDALFRHALDGLLDYPYGCVEQTSSRLLPLALAYPRLTQGEPRIGERLRLILQNGRLRLMHLAGPNAQFSWWGDSEAADAFLTAYAYYADWHASRSLGISLPAEHWQRVLELYSEQAEALPPLQRALILDFAHAMGLPVASLLQGVLEALESSSIENTGDTQLDPRSGLVLHDPDSPLGHAAAQVLAAQLARTLGVEIPPTATAEALLMNSGAPLAQALLLRHEHFDAVVASDLLARLAPEHATLERALVLTWMHQAAAANSSSAPALQGDWQVSAGAIGLPAWRWQGATLPQTIELAAEPQQPLQALLSYHSDAPLRSTLPLKIERRLWRLVPGAGSFEFRAEPVSGGPLASDALYLDEITLEADADTALRYGLVEVPLPPGGEVERTTWGIQVSGLSGSDAAALEKARHEPGELHYAVPLDGLQGQVQFRHLLRFSQKGEFHLPPVRYHSMYAPEQQAFEAKPALGQIVVQ